MIPLVLLAVSVLHAGPDSVPSDQLDALAAKERRLRNTCGPMAVWYCLRRTGKTAGYQDVLARAQLGEDGMDLEGLIGLSAAYGMPGKAVTGPKANLELLPSPSILVIGGTHCVVYEGVEPGGQMARVFEPASRRVLSVPTEQLRRQWSGEAILFADPGLSPPAFAAVALLAALAVLAAAGGFGYLRARPLR